MRPEQVTRLAAIEEALIDVFIAEAEPKRMPGMKTAQDRGDRYWFKKNALATLRLVANIQTVLREINVGDQGGDANPKPAETDGTKEREAEAAALTKQGIAILDRHRKARGEK